jgi:hypothetical protein
MLELRARQALFQRRGKDKISFLEFVFSRWVNFGNFLLLFNVFLSNFMTRTHFPVVLIFPDFWPTADLDACTGSVCGRLSLLLSLSPENVFKQKF